MQTDGEDGGSEAGAGGCVALAANCVGGQGAEDAGEADYPSMTVSSLVD